MFRADKIRLSFSSESTINVLPAKPSDPRDAAKSFVFGLSIDQPSTTTTFPSLTLSDNADRRAPCRIFRGMLYDQSRGCGPCALPPPFHRGDLSDAIRARPVPFCFHSFLPAPETSPRVFVAEVPCRAFAMKLRTAAWIKPSLRGAPKTTSDSSTSPTSSFSILRTLTVGITFSVLLLLWLHDLRRFANHHNAAVRTRHRATNHQNVVFGIDSRDGQALGGDTRVAHVTRRSVSLDDSRGISRSTDRTRRADIHRSMRLGTAIEVVTLNRARKAATF